MRTLCQAQSDHGGKRTCVNEDYMTQRNAPLQVVRFCQVKLRHQKLMILVLIF